MSPPEPAAACVPLRVSVSSTYPCFEVHGCPSVQQQRCYIDIAVVSRDVEGGEPALRKSTCRKTCLIEEKKKKNNKQKLERLEEHIRPKVSVSQHAADFENILTLHGHLKHRGTGRSPMHDAVFPILLYGLKFTI